MKLNKVYTALITPFQANGEVDYDALKKLVDHLYQQNMRGFLISGTTGEGPTLCDDEKIKMVKLLKKEFPDISIMLGVGSNDTTATVASIQKFNQLKEVDAYLCVVPYYNRPSQEGIYAHFMTLDLVSTKPIILYNVPKRCGVDIHFETLLNLAKNSMHIIGLKQASEDLEMIYQMKQEIPDFIIYSGEDGHLLEGLYAGADGVISVVSHLIPSSILNLVEEFDEWQNLEPLDDYIKLISKYCFIEANPMPVKYILSRLGYIENVLRLPLTPLSKKGQNQLDLLIENNTFQ